jgi:carbon monoxide dehydrogenase subunit G
MKFENRFAVPAPIEEVWSALMDVQRVAPCMPGAEVLEETGDDIYKVGVKVKLGPISMLYRGQVEITDRDESARQATMSAKAKEARGQGTADAQIHMGLVQGQDATDVTLDTELRLSGRAAAMGRGVIADVAQKLSEEFAANLASMLVSEPATAPASDPAAASASDPAAAPASEPAQLGSRAATPPPPTPIGPPPPAAPPSPPGGSLPTGKIAASVIARRLERPRTLLLATTAVAGLGAILGYAVARRR